MASSSKKCVETANTGKQKQKNAETKRFLNEARQFHGQLQTKIPMALIVTQIFPFAFDKYHQAVKLMLTCRSALVYISNQKEFWEPFLQRLLKTRASHIPGLLSCYVMWPEHMFKNGGVIGVVQSKLVFTRLSDCSDEFTYNRRDESMINFYYSYWRKSAYIESLSKHKKNYQIQIGYNLSTTRVRSIEYQGIVIDGVVY